MKVLNVEIVPERLQLINTVATVADATTGRTVTAYALQRDYGVWVAQTLDAAADGLIEVRRRSGAEFPQSAYMTLSARIDDFDLLDTVCVSLSPRGEAMAAVGPNVALMTLYKAERQRCRLDLLCHTAGRTGVLAVLDQGLAWAACLADVKVNSDVTVRAGRAIEPERIEAWTLHAPAIARHVHVKPTVEGRKYLPLL